MKIFIRLFCLALLCWGSSGCCTFKGWFGMLNYSLVVFTHPDAKDGGAPVELFLLWPDPAQNLLVDGLKNPSQAKDWALRHQAQGLCEYLDFPAKFPPNTRSLVPDPQRGETRQPRLFCNATLLYVFSDLPVESSENFDEKLVKKILLTDPSRPATNYFVIEVMRRDIAVHFKNSAAELELQLSSSR
jgi:hypothetical protein